MLFQSDCLALTLTLTFQDVTVFLTWSSGFFQPVKFGEVFAIRISVFPEIGVPPVIIHLNGIFHEINNPFGVPPLKSLFDEARFYIGSLVLILEALHIAGVAYRDLKPEARQIWCRLWTSENVLMWV